MCCQIQEDRAVMPSYSVHCAWKRHLHHIPIYLTWTNVGKRSFWRFFLCGTLLLPLLLLDSLWQASFERRLPNVFQSALWALEPSLWLQVHQRLHCKIGQAWVTPRCRARVLSLSSESQRTGVWGTSYLGNLVVSMPCRCHWPCLRLLSEAFSSMMTWQQKAASCAFLCQLATDRSGQCCVAVADAFL